MMTGPLDLPCGREAAHGSDAGCVACLKGKSEAVATFAPVGIAPYLDARFAAAADAIAAAHAIVCPSEFAAERVRAAFGDGCAERIRILGHGVNDFPLVFPQAGRPMLRVAYLGRFNERKGAHHLAQAAQRLAGERIVFEAWGLMDARLQGLARASGIVLRGLYTHEDMPRALRGIDLVVVPSVVEESFCLVLSEAQRLGIPVAASRSGAMPERIREGETGFLFEAGDVDALVALLLRLRDDRSALEAVAARLREERPKTLARNAAEYLALYRELAASRGASLAPARSESADLTRRWLGLPRARSRTPLGDDAYDRWMAHGRRAEAEPIPVRRDLAGGGGDLRLIVLPSAADAPEDLRGFNRAVADAGSEWVALAQEGDLLEADAIATLARACGELPRAALVYCDHDAVSARGERYDPLFKPRFSPELLRHAPYIAGLCAVRCSRLLEMGGFRAPGWTGVVEFALRLAKSGDPSAVASIREILVHRRDTNLRALEDPGTLRALHEAVSDQLHRDGARPLFLSAIPGAPGMWAHAPAGAAPVTLFVRCAHAPAEAAGCIESLLQRSGNRIAQLIVDLPESAFRELSTALAAAGHRVAMTSVAGMAQSPLAVALQRTRTEWLAVVDARCANFTGGWLERLEQGIVAPYTAAIAPNLRGAQGGVLPGWEVIGAGSWAVAGAPPGLQNASALAELYGLPREVSALSGRVALLRRDAAVTSVALDELDRAGGFEMAHLCLALSAAGYDLIARPFIAADFRGATEAPPARTSASALGIPPEVEWMRGRWGERLDDDPHFHPDITLGRERIATAMRFPPRESTGPRAPRICAFPFDRWGSGELRVRQPCAGLERADLAHVLLMPEHDTGRVPNLLEWRRLDPDTLFAHNFFHDYQLLALEDYARHSKCLRVLGLDDLLTDLPEDNPFHATIYSDIGERIARASSFCDRLVVSTEELANAYGGGKDVRIIPNAIDGERWAGLANRPRGGAKPRVGWAGARQHLGDLALLEPVVKATCARIDWVFLGMCPPALRAFAHEFHDMVPIRDYPEKLASLGLDAAVAPLRDLPFNRAKSHLKLLEYGILGIPVVASDVAPYRGSPAILVDETAASWTEAILALVFDPDHARALGARMRDWVLTNGMLSRMLQEWLRALDPDQGRTT